MGAEDKLQSKRISPFRIAATRSKGAVFINLSAIHC